MHRSLLIIISNWLYVLSLMYAAPSTSADPSNQYRRTISLLEPGLESVDLLCKVLHIGKDDIGRKVLFVWDSSDCKPLPWMYVSLSLSLSVCVCVSECLHVCLHRCRQCKHTAICCSSPLQLGPHLRVSVSLRCCMRTFNVSDPTDASRARTSNVYSLTLPYFVCNCISPDRVMKHR